MKKIDSLAIGDALFDNESGDSAMYKSFVEAADDFDVAVISSTSLCCENPVKNIKDTLAINKVVATEDVIKNHCVVTGVEKHSKFRWTIFGAYVYSSNRIMVNVFDVQFDR